eukprot:m.324774 g.324774  ORF g.324774 m.324774 type:complete len:72 (-) comp16544_c0_seq25:393-608(-)
MSLTTFTSTINASSTVLQTSSSSNITLNVGIKNSGSMTGNVLFLCNVTLISVSCHLQKVQPLYCLIVFCFR